ncbi:Zinc finger MYND domain-containing protein 10 [Elasticomyces elasticus]|nr:Zinc finger MYND domain-containing protein 10 [Elasticomyces elasticus]
MATTAVCPICDESASQVCVGCRDIHYCSQECQEADWCAHKLLCKTFAKMKFPPNQGMVRAIYFPPLGSKPQFLWLQVEQVASAGDIGLKYEARIGRRLPDRKVIKQNAITDAFLEQHLNICYDASLFTVNSSVVKAMGDSSRKTVLRGPILAFCGRESIAEADGTNNTNQLRDMGMEAYSHIMAYLICSSESDAGSVAIRGPKVQAVKVLCNGALKGDEKARFQAVALPRMHPSAREAPPHLVSALSKRIGLRLRFVKAQTPKQIDLMNTLISPMLVFPPDETMMTAMWHGAWLKLKSGTGNVHIIRDDLGHLDVATMEVYAAFSIHAYATVTHIRYIPVHQVGPYDMEATRNVNRETWRVFLRDWAQDKVAKLNEVNMESTGDEIDLLSSIRGVRYEIGPPFNGGRTFVAYPAVGEVPAVGLIESAGSRA